MWQGSSWRQKVALAKILHNMELDPGQNRSRAKAGRLKLLELVRTLLMFVERAQIVLDVAI
jgi:hypothetical protein